MTTTLNINRLVTVTLTPEGQAYLARYMAEECESWGGISHPHPHAKMNDDQPHEWQLWELMRVFGPGLLNGGPTFFEGNEITLAPPKTAHPETADTLAGQLMARRCDVLGECAGLMNAASYLISHPYPGLSEELRNKAAAATRLGNSGMANLQAAATVRPGPLSDDEVNDNLNLRTALRAAVKEISEHNSESKYHTGRDLENSMRLAAGLDELPRYDNERANSSHY